MCVSVFFYNARDFELVKTEISSPPDFGDPQTDVDICGVEWKVLTTAHWIAAKLDADILRKISTCQQANLLNVTVLTSLLQAC